jgi:hypothetical protein
MPSSRNKEPMLFDLGNTLAGPGFKPRIKAALSIGEPSEGFEGGASENGKYCTLRC